MFNREKRKSKPDARRAYEAGYRKGWQEAMLKTAEHVDEVLLNVPPFTKVITGVEGLLERNRR